MSRSDAGAIPAAGVAIFDETGALLLGRHAHDGRWATFGGTIESGEDAATAAKREVAEELGIRVDGLEPLGTFNGDRRYTVRYQDGSTETYTVTMFCAVLKRRPTVTLNRLEIMEAQWISSDALSSVGLAPDMFEIVPAAYDWFSSRRG